MKTPAQDMSQISLPIRPWLTVRFSQPVLFRQTGQAEGHLRKAHSLQEIRQHTHELFMAQGGTPAKELDDWRHADQQPERERARANHTPEDL